MSNNRHPSHDFTGSSIRRRNLKHKSTPYQMPRSWAGLAAKAREDLERNKRLLG